MIFLFSSPICFTMSSISEETYDVDQESYNWKPNKMQLLW